MKKILFSFCLFGSISVSLPAQQTDRYGHEFFLPVMYNPAFTGSRELMNASLISRTQWIDFKNAPQQNIFMLDGMLPEKKMGLGVNLFSLRKGISRQTGGGLYYAYRVKLGEQAFLSAGISLNIIDHTLFYSEAVIQDPKDPVLTGTSQRETNINANAGLRISLKGLDIGFAAPQLLGNSLEIQDNVLGNAYYAASRHYLGSLSYRFTLTKSGQFLLTPQAVIHYFPGAPIYYDANLNLEWRDKLWLGATYKSDHAIAANAGFYIRKRLYAGYSYDIIIGNVGAYSGASHEIMLGFIFGGGKHAGTPPADTTAPMSAVKEKLDSLQNELEIKDNKISSEKARAEEKDREIKKLREENEKLKAGATPQPDQPKNEAGPVKPPVDAVKSAPEYVYADNNKKVKKGYYVVTGAFVNRNYADEQLKLLQHSGYHSAKLIYLAEKGYTYVSPAVHSSKEKALRDLNKLKAKGMAEVWILTIEY